MDDELGSENNPRPYVKGQAYAKGEYVIYNGVVYRSNSWKYAEDDIDPEIYSSEVDIGMVIQAWPWTVIRRVASQLPLPVEPGLALTPPNVSKYPVVVATRRAKMPRVQSVILQILREWPDLEGVHVGSWGNAIDYREFPYINIRRPKLGGLGRNDTFPDKMDMTIIEMTAYSTDGLIECEHIYNIALEALYDAVQYQKQTDTGYLHSIRETMGMSQFSSPYMDSWRVQGLIRLGLRPISTLS